VINLTRSLAIQLAPHNIRVNCVVPNKIGSPVAKDEFNPDRKVLNLRNRPGEPIDPRRAMLFLVSEDSDFIAGTGAVRGWRLCGYDAGRRLSARRLLLQALKDHAAGKLLPGIDPASHRVRTMRCGSPKDSDFAKTILDRVRVDALEAAK
jgi:hypothetical protein